MIADLANIGVGGWCALVFCAGVVCVFIGMCLDERR